MAKYVLCIFSISFILGSKNNKAQILVPPPMGTNLMKFPLKKNADSDSNFFNPLVVVFKKK